MGKYEVSENNIDNKIRAYNEFQLRLNDLCGCDVIVNNVLEFIKLHQEEIRKIFNTDANNLSPNLFLNKSEGGDVA